MNKTIFIIEDDAVIADSIRELLEDSGYLVRQALNGHEALGLLGSMSKMPSLILLDLTMPIMDGFEFRQKQIADPALKDIPLLIMSADGHVTEKKVKAQALGYIRKPFDIFDLLKKVETHAS